MAEGLPATGAIVFRRAEQAIYTLFDADEVRRLAGDGIELRDVGINDFELVPGGGFEQQVHDDKLEVVVAIPLGETEGMIVRYTDDAGSYCLDLGAQDSILIPRNVPHKAQNICNTHVVLITVNFRYVE